jgi:hypothetical protein
VKLCVEGPELRPNNWFVHRANTQLTLSSSSQQKTKCCSTGTLPTQLPFIRFGFQWLLSFPKIEVFLEGLKMSGHWRSSENCDGSTDCFERRVPNSVSIAGLSV